MSAGKRRKVESLEFADTGDLLLAQEDPLNASMESLEPARQFSSFTQPMLSQENSYNGNETKADAPLLSEDMSFSDSERQPEASVGFPHKKSRLTETHTATAPWPLTKDGSTMDIRSIISEPKVFARGDKVSENQSCMSLGTESDISPELLDTEATMSSRRSPLLRQAATRRFTFSEEDSNDSSSDLAGADRATFLRGISAELLAGYDDVDAGCETDENGSDVLCYLRRTPSDVQTMVANYLSSGKLETLVLTQDNFHYFLHVSTLLNLQRLRDHCMEFCIENNHKEILDLVADCKGSCKADLEKEKSCAVQRTQSILSDNEESSAPQYLVAFSRDDSAKRKTTVNVLDLWNFANIFERQMEKPYQFGPGFACASIDLEDAPYVFVSGGEGKGLSSMWKFDVLMARWSKCAKMNHGRSYHGMVTVKGKLYVIGGVEVPCIEEYDPVTDKWSECGSLAVHVSKPAVEVLGRKVYIFGGKTPAGAVASLQIFDVNGRSAQKLCDLPIICYGGDAVALDNYIFYASNQGHMICLDTTNGVSQLCAHQPTKKKYFAMTSKNERLYIVGGVPGNNEDEDIKSYPQYRFNPHKNSWVQKERLNKCFPVYAHCIVRFPRRCPIIPFDQPL